MPGNDERPGPPLKFLNLRLRRLSAANLTDDPQN